MNVTIVKGINSWTTFHYQKENDEEKHYSKLSTPLPKHAKKTKNIKNLNLKQTITEASNIASTNKSWI